ncbi:MAG: inositol monophosphatase family protein [Gemmatimonadota bacterium]
MIAPAELAALREFAVSAARAAGRITLDHFGTSLTVEKKADGSPVTIADRAAEEYLRQRLAAACPGDGIIGEEFGASDGASGRRWTVDPIDGTIAFARGVPLYGVLLGLLDGDDAVLGVIHLPAWGETVAAARGVGCQWWRGADVARGGAARVSATSALGDALVCCTDFTRLPRGAGPGFGALAAAAGRLRTWGDCWGHALVATGRADAMIDPKMAIWDSAPLQPIVEEAGGRFTTLAGVPDPAGGSAVSTNGHIHAAVLAATYCG